MTQKTRIQQPIRQVYLTPLMLRNCPTEIVGNADLRPLRSTVHSRGGVTPPVVPMPDESGNYNKPNCHLSPHWGDIGSLVH